MIYEEEHPYLDGGNLVMEFGEGEGACMHGDIIMVM